MRNFVYELLSFKETDFPMIFDYYHMNTDFNDVFYHWHINIEMLYFVSGSAEISINGEVFWAEAGNVVIVNSNHIHSIKLHGEECQYYCLILDYDFCREVGFDITEATFCEKTDDPEIIHVFNDMIRESTDQRSHWKKAMRALSISMIILLYRNQMINNRRKVTDSNKIELVKSAINYINKNLTNEISLDEVATELCISKYYFCRIFKDITGQTLKGYLIAIRCHHARALLQKGNVNITECAQMCGFNNTSYFSKCYKNQFGYLPSRELSH